MTSYPPEMSNGCEPSASTSAQALRAVVTTACLLFSLIPASFPPVALGAERLLPLSDNQKPPYMAVWLELKAQPQAINDYAKWLNRTVVWADISPCMFHQPGKTWPEVELPFDTLWSKWITEVPGRRAILAAPMLPPDGSTLAKGATGAFNSHFEALAKNLVANNLGNTILCMGPGAWGVPWKVANKADAANFVLYWRQIVTTMRAVPGADKLHFDWVGSAGKTDYSLEDAYPGDTFVDFIGMNLGEGTNDRSIYPYPPFVSDSERLYRQKKAWNIVYCPALEKLNSFAKAHNKPFSIPMWNLAAGHERNSGLDAPYFIESMYRYIQDPANNIYFASYFEYYHYSRLSPTGGYVSTWPKSTEAFQKLFSLPAR